MNHGLSGPVAEALISMTLITVALSVVVHGIAETLLMTLYAGRQQRERRRHPDENRRSEVR